MQAIFLTRRRYCQSISPAGDVNWRRAYIFCSGGQYVSYGNESSSFAPRAVLTPKQKQPYFSVIIDNELFP